MHRLAALVLVVHLGACCMGGAAPAAPPPPGPLAPSAVAEVPAVPTEPAVPLVMSCLRGPQCSWRRPTAAFEISGFRSTCESDFGGGSGTYAAGPCSPTGILGGCRYYYGETTFYYDGADLAYLRTRCEEYSMDARGPVGVWLSSAEASTVFF